MSFQKQSSAYPTLFHLSPTILYASTQSSPQIYNYTNITSTIPSIDFVLKTTKITTSKYLRSLLYLSNLILAAFLIGGYPIAIPGTYLPPLPHVDLLQPFFKLPPLPILSPKYTVLLVWKISMKPHQPIESS